MLLRGGTPGAASALALLLLAACGSSDGSTSTSTSASAGTSSTSSSAATPAASGSVAAAAQAFAATLSADQSSSLMQTYSLANAEKWSNLPQTLLRGSQARIGLQLSTLSSDQQKALAALLQTATGTATNEGWDEIQQLWNADDYLSANGGGSDYGRGNYYIAFLGTPGDSGTWELQFGGHHLALANTYTAGALVGATPSFRGVEPFTTFTENGTSNQPLQQEQSAFAALLAGLSSDQQATAKLSKTYSDLVLKPGADWQFPTTKEGIKGSDLSAEQKALVVAAMQTYVGDIDDADAATIMAKYTSELDDTYVAFSGTTALTAQNDYIRIDGPSVWIEFSMQHGIVLSGNHPHSVWRDRITDYGGTQS
jgi:hypothetical protein